MAQRAVARLVAERVVDLLEVVDVEQRDRERVAGRAQLLHRAVERPPQARSVRGPGQVIGQQPLARLRELALEPLDLDLERRRPLGALAEVAPGVVEGVVHRTRVGDQPAHALGDVLERVGVRDRLQVLVQRLAEVVRVLAEMGHLQHQMRQQVAQRDDRVAAAAHDRLLGDQRMLQQLARRGEQSAVRAVAHRVAHRVDLRDDPAALVGDRLEAVAQRHDDLGELGVDLAQLREIAPGDQRVVRRIDLRGRVRLGGPLVVRSGPGHRVALGEPRLDGRGRVRPGARLRRVYPPLHQQQLELRAQRRIVRDVLVRGGHDRVEPARRRPVAPRPHGQLDDRGHQRAPAAARRLLRDVQQRRQRLAPALLAHRGGQTGEAGLAGLGTLRQQPHRGLRDLLGVGAARWAADLRPGLAVVARGGRELALGEVADRGARGLGRRGRRVVAHGAGGALRGVGDGFHDTDSREGPCGAIARRSASESASSNGTARP